MTAPSSTVAFLGTGTMGLPMARNVAAAGARVQAWNRTRRRAEPLAEAGVEVLGTAAEAVRGADLIVTMLSDAGAVVSAMTGEDGALGAAGGDSVWAQMSTIGLDGLERCRELARDHGVELVDAPVLGTKQPAERGELVVLASGSDAALSRCEPVFEAVGSRTMSLGPTGTGTRVKLVVNHWLVSVVEGLAETIALAQALGVEPETFLETIEGGPLDLPYAQMKGRAMIARDFEPAFSLALARKDTGLVIDAARAHGFEAALAQMVAEQMDRAIELGHGERDLAATFHASLDGSSGERGAA